MPTIALFPAWIWFAFGSAFFAALTAILGKIGVAKINSDMATFVRTIVILIVIAFMLSLRREWQSLARLDRGGLVALILSGVATGFSWICYYRALQLGPASRVAPIDKLSLALVIVLAAVFLGEAPSIKTILGAALIVGGAILVALG